MKDRTITLTRRKILASVGAVGAAGAGAGLGTSALFSDEESVTNNSITAGTLDLSVTATIEGANEYWEERVEATEDADLAIDGLSKTVNGEVQAGLTVSDVKPGDWTIICFEFEVEANPAYVQLTTANLTSSEHGFEEPEPDIGESGGELEDEMLALIYERFKGVQPSNNANPPYSYLRNNSRVTSRDSTVRETYDLLSDGYTLLDANANPLVVGSGENAARRYLLLHLPTDVGNVVQGDSFSLDLVVTAEQVRNNASPFEGSFPANPAGHWPLDSIGDGTVEDVVGTNDGTPAGGVSSVSGQVGQAASFDGVDDYVSIPDDPSLDLTDAFALSAWVKAPSGQDSYARILSREQSGVGNRQYNLVLDQSATLPRTIVDTVDTNNIEVVGSDAIDDDQWHHLATTFDSATELRLYVDGTEVDATPVSSPVVSRASPVTFGAPAHLPGKDVFTGRIDDVRIYDRPLSSSEVSALSNLP